jgi:hypothetical protein
MPFINRTKPLAGNQLLGEKIKNKLTILFVITLMSLSWGEMITISHAKLKIDIPAIYKEVPTPNSNNKMKVTRFKREGILNPNNIKVFPNVAIITEQLKDSVDVIQYSIFRKKFNIDDFISPSDSIFSINAAGFRGNYNEIRNGNKIFHKVIVLFQTKKKLGIEIIFDTTEDTYPKVEKEFLKILKSIKEAP